MEGTLGTGWLPRFLRSRAALAPGRRGSAACGKPVGSSAQGRQQEGFEPACDVVVVDEVMVRSIGIARSSRVARSRCRRGTDPGGLELGEVAAQQQGVERDRGRDDGLGHGALAGACRAAAVAWCSMLTVRLLSSVVGSRYVPGARGGRVAVPHAWSPSRTYWWTSPWTGAPARPPPSPTPRWVEASRPSVRRTRRRSSAGCRPCGDGRQR